MKRLITTLIAALLVLAPAGTALAHHPVIVGEPGCHTDGSYEVNWIVRADAVRGLTWSVNGEDDRPDSESFQFRTLHDISGPHPSFTANAIWSNQVTSKVTAKTHRPDPCPEETTTSTSTTSTTTTTTTEPASSTSTTTTTSPVTSSSTSTSSPSTSSPDTTVTSTPDSTSSTTLNSPTTAVAPTTAVSGPTTSTPSPRIPATGVDNGLLAVFAAALITLGGVALLVRRHP